MNKRTPSLSFLALLTLALGFVFSSLSLSAQTDQQADPSQPTAQQPGQSPSQQPPTTEQTPQPQTETQQEQSQTFSGTIMKSGSKYVLQDAASGKTYDIDNQDVAKKYDGKQVRINGTLDSDGKTIHVTK